MKLRTLRGFVTVLLIAAAVSTAGCLLVPVPFPVGGGGHGRGHAQRW